ncbi:MAG: HEPN domain-containing protein [Desulfotomaculales bacterium]
MTSPEIGELMGKARESLAAARLLYREGYFAFAASRAYYAMFHAAQAALLGRGLSFSKHTAVIAAFGRELAKPGLVPAHLHRYLLDAFDLRQISDYGAPGAVGREQAAAVLTRAEEFIASVAALPESPQQV